MNIAMSPVFSFGMQFTSDGKPLAGGLIYTYEAGSNSLLKATYDNDLGTPIPNSNPIVLNSSGRLETSIWLETAQVYHFVLQAPGGAILESIDYVAGAVSQQYVQEALEELDTKFLPLTGGSISGNLTVLGVTSLKNTSIVGSLSASGNVTLGPTTATSVTALLNANNGRIINVAAPTDATDGANKAYVDSGVSSTNPPGVVMFTAGSAAPAGYLLADGASKSRAEYPGLFAAIGTVYGAVDANSFNVPDLRGYFIRGADQGRGVDPNRQIGSNQAGQVTKHIHNSGWGEVGGGYFGRTNTANYTGSGDSDNGNYLFATNDGTDYDGITNNGVIGNETRPVNIAMIAIIKI